MSKSSANLQRYHYYDDEDLFEFIKQETLFWCQKLGITQSELFEASEHELQKIFIVLRQRELLDDIQTADYIYGDRLVCEKTLNSEFCRVTGGCDNDDESLLRILRRFAGEISQTFNVSKLQSALERSSDMDFDEDCSETSDIEEDFYGGGSILNSTFNAGAGACGPNATFDAGPGACGGNATFDAGPGACGGNATFNASPGGCGGNATFNASPGGCGGNATFNASPGGCGGNATFNASPGGCGLNATYDAGPGGCGGNATFDAGPGGCGGNATFDAGPGGCGGNATFDAGPGGCGPNATFDIGPGGCGPNATFDVGPGGGGPNATYNAGPPPRSPHRTPLFQYQPPQVPCPPGCQPIPGYDPYVDDIFYTSNNDLKMSWANVETDYVPEVKSPTGGGSPFRPNPFMCSTPGEYRFQRRYQFGDRTKPGDEEFQDPMNDTLLDPFNDASRDYCPNFQHSAEEDYEIDQYFLKKWKNEKAQGGKQCPGSNSSRSSGNCSANSSSSSSSCNRTKSLCGGNATFSASSCSSNSSAGGGNRTFNTSPRSGCGSPCGGNATFNASPRSGSGSPCAGNATFNASPRSGSGSQCGGNATFNASSRSGSCSPCGGNATFNASSSSSKCGGGRTPNFGNLPGMSSPYDSIANTSPPELVRSPCDALDNTSPPSFYRTPMQNTSTPQFCGTPQSSRPSTRPFCDTTPGGRGSNASMRSFQQFRQNRQCSGGGSSINCDRPLSVPAQQYIQHCLGRPSGKPPIGDVVFRPPPDGCVPCWGSDNSKPKNPSCCCSCPPGFPKICPRVEGVDYEETFLKPDGDETK